MSTTRADHERFHLILEGTSTVEHGPAARRLARALKYALRACGLKCISAVRDGDEGRPCDRPSQGQRCEASAFSEVSAISGTARATPVLPRGGK